MYILKTLLIIATLVCSCHTVFIPELFTTVTSDFLNKQIAVNYGSNISDLINKANIKDLPPIDQKVDGVHIRANLTNIKQKININWNTNILFVTGRHNFTIKSKGVNISLDADLEFKIGLTPKQKGNLTIEITKLETDTYLYFAGSHCPISAGFDVQVSSIYANS